MYKGDNPYGVDDERYLSMRAEVEAPFRTARIFLLGFFAVSAGLATLFATSQLIGAAAHAPAARSLTEALQTFAIDVGSLALIFYFLRRDLDGRRKQMLRMGREERLASCQLELANGKTIPLGRLRSFCRPVIFCGTPDQVAAARQAALPFRDELSKRGVFLIPLPLLSQPGEADLLPQMEKDDAEAARWEGRVVRADDWKAWFQEQASVAGKGVDNGLYIGLRLDGRVRASGVGCPPWSTFVKQLAPVEGMWRGVLDGMDGRVGG